MRMRSLPALDARWMISAAFSGDVRATLAEFASQDGVVSVAAVVDVEARVLDDVRVDPAGVDGDRPHAGARAARGAATRCSRAPRTSTRSTRSASGSRSARRRSRRSRSRRRPAPAGSAGTRACRGSTPQKLTSITHSSSSWRGVGGRLRDGHAGVVEDEADRRSAPIRLTSAANAIWPPRSRTSSLRASTGPSIVAAVSCRPSSFQSQIATGQPWRASRCASARPMPEPAPLMTAVRPSSAVPAPLP